MSDSSKQVVQVVSAISVVVGTAPINGAPTIPMPYADLQSLIPKQFALTLLPIYGFSLLVTIFAFGLTGSLARAIALE